MSRWAKVPAWLLPALIAAPRDKRSDASPHLALACYAIIAVEYADFRTGVAQVKRAQLARDLSVHTRTIRRALSLLDAVGAATIEDVTERGGQAANLVTLHLEPRRTRHPLTHASDPLDARVTPPQDETAGQDARGVTHAPPLYSESQLLPEAPNASQEEQEASVWDELVTLAPQQQLPVIEAVPMPPSVREALHPLRAMRETSEGPGRSSRLSDPGGTPGGDAGDREEWTSGSTAESGAGTR